jgi:hypothetical protein
MLVIDRQKVLAVLSPDLGLRKHLIESLSQGRSEARNLLAQILKDRDRMAKKASTDPAP